MEVAPWAASPRAPAAEGHHRAHVPRRVRALVSGTAAQDSSPAKAPPPRGHDRQRQVGAARRAGPWPQQPLVPSLACPPPPLPVLLRSTRARRRQAVSAQLSRSRVQQRQGHVPRSYYYYCSLQGTPRPHYRCQRRRWRRRSRSPARLEQQQRTRQRQRCSPRRTCWGRRGLLPPSRKTPPAPGTLAPA